LFKGSGCANGMGFTLDRSTFYWTCSSRRKIFRFAYDAASGALKEQGVLHECTDDHQTPDGMTVDTAGHVWSARWGGQSVLELAADGTLLRTIEMPTSRITSAAFGGSDLEDLYCTSAGGSADDPSAAGALFRVSGTGARGMREFRSRVAI
jgi:D-xylonolactonase